MAEPKKKIPPTKWERRKNAQRKKRKQMQLPLPAPSRQKGKIEELATRPGKFQQYIKVHKVKGAEGGKIGE